MFSVVKISKGTDVRLWKFPLSLKWHILCCLSTVGHSWVPHRKKVERGKGRNEGGDEISSVCFSAFLSQACYRSSFPAGRQVNNSHVYMYRHWDQALPTCLSFGLSFKVIPSQQSLVWLAFKQRVEKTNKRLKCSPNILHAQREIMGQ